MLLKSGLEEEKIHDFLLFLTHVSQRTSIKRLGIKLLNLNPN